jgi:hypothetical protein
VKLGLESLRDEVVCRVDMHRTLIALGCLKRASCSKEETRGRTRRRVDAERIRQEIAREEAGMRGRDDSFVRRARVAMAKNTRRNGEQEDKRR